MSAVDWWLVATIYLLVICLLAAGVRSRSRFPRLAPIPALPGLELVPCSLALLQAWTRCPDDVSIDHWAAVHAEVARLMPSVAEQLDRLEALRAETTRAAAGIRAGQVGRGSEDVPVQSSWTRQQHTAHVWRPVEGMAGVEWCGGCGALRG